jgi:hypothetical protein
MEHLLKQAMEFLFAHPEFNEVELQEGSIRVRVVRLPATYPYPPRGTW